MYVHVFFILVKVSSVIIYMYEKRVREVVDRSNSKVVETAIDVSSTNCTNLKILISKP